MDILTPEEKEIFELTQGHRKRVIELMTQDGRYPVNDTESLGMLVKVLSELDKNQLNLAKLRVAAKRDDDNKQNAELMASILKGIAYDKRDALPVNENIVSEIPALPDNPEITDTIRPEELELPKPMGEAEAEYDRNDIEEEGE